MSYVTDNTIVNTISNIINRLSKPDKQFNKNMWYNIIEYKNNQKT